MYDDIASIAQLYYSILRAMCPQGKTLNLINSIKLTILDDDSLEFQIGDDETNYAPSTNEYWTVNPDRFPSGKKRPPSSRNALKSKNTGYVNPNLEWIDKALEQASLLIAQVNNGSVIKNGS